MFVAALSCRLRYELTTEETARTRRYRAAARAGAALGRAGAEHEAAKPKEIHDVKSAAQHEDRPRFLAARTPASGGGDGERQRVRRAERRQRLAGARLAKTLATLARPEAHRSRAAKRCG